MKRCFNWFVLFGFILYVVLYFSTAHFAGKSMVQLEEFFESHDGEVAVAEDDSPIDLMLLEYLDLIEDFPRTDTSKPSHKGATSVYQNTLKPVLQKAVGALAPRGHVIPCTCTVYSPLHFSLSDYYGFLFRLTPF